MSDLGQIFPELRQLHSHWVLISFAIIAQLAVMCHITTYTGGIQRRIAGRVGPRHKARPFHCQHCFMDPTQRMKGKNELAMWSCVRLAITTSICNLLSLLQNTCSHIFSFISQNNPVRRDRYNCPHLTDGKN